MHTYRICSALIVSSYVMLVPVNGMAADCAALGNAIGHETADWLPIEDSGGLNVKDPEVIHLNDRANTPNVVFSSNDRIRLLNESKAIDATTHGIVRAYLDTANTPTDSDGEGVWSEIDYLMVHRWKGMNVFAIAAHDSATVCEIDWAFIYTDSAGVSHVTKAPDLRICKTRVESNLYKGQLVLSTIEEQYDAGPGEPVEIRSVGLWTGRAFEASCKLAMTYDLGWETDYGQNTKYNSYEVFMAQNIATIANAYHADYRRQLAGESEVKAKVQAEILQSAGVIGEADTAVALQIYQTVTEDLNSASGEYYYPVAFNGVTYLIGAAQAYDRNGIFPAINLTMYGFQGGKPVILGELAATTKRGSFLSYQILTN